MADNDDKLSAKPQIDTSDFKTGISSMNRDIRVLESGFRAAAASLGDWANDATGMELRLKSLSSQLEIQKQKVAATKAEYERLKAEHGEGSRAAEEMEIKLNKETETLGKMQNELTNTEASLNEMQSSSDEAGNAVEESGNQAEESGSKFEGFASVVQSAGGVIASVVKTTITVVSGLALAVAGVGASIGALVINASNAAGEIQDLSDKTGISTENLQELKFIGDQTGTSLETITGAQARLIRSMSGASDAVDQYNQKLEDAQAAGKDMEEVQADLDKNINPTLQAFNSLGIAVRDSSGNLRDNKVVFAEAIDALGKIQNPAERDALAMQIFGKSAQELNPIIKLGKQGMADMAAQAHELGAVMDSDDVASLDNFGDMLTALKDGLQGTLGTLATAFLPGLQQVFGPNGAGKYLKEFTQIVSGANGDFGKIAQGLTGLVTEIATDVAKQAPQMLKAGLSIVKSILTAIIAALPQMLDAAIQIINALITFIVQALPQLLPAAVQILLTLVTAIIQNLPMIIEAAIQAVIALANGLTQALPTLIPAVVQAIVTIVQTLVENLPLLIDAALQLILALAQGLIVALPILIQALPSIISTLISGLIEALPQFADVAGQIIGVLATGIIENIPVLISAGADLLVQLVTKLKDSKVSWQTVGKSFIEGIGEGIKSAASALYQIVVGVVEEMIATVMGTLQQSSPSRVGIGIGGNFFRSIGLGGLGAVSDVQKMFAFGTNRLVAATAGGFGMSSSSLDQSVTNNIDLFGNVFVQGATTPESFAGHLRARRF
jgi:phage-related protein